MNAIEDLPAMSTPPVLAAYLGVSVGTLARWRMNGEGPRWIKVGQAARYPRESVRAWLAANERDTISKRGQ